MTCTICHTSPFESSHFTSRKVSKMNTRHTTISLQSTERKAITKGMSLLLIEFGNLIKSHPDLRTGLTPNCGELLISLGEKLNKIA